MNSRERIVCSIAHREPDRIPIDLGASTVTGISTQAYNQLKALMGKEVETRVFDVVQQLAEIDDSILNDFGVDAIDLNRIFMDDMEWYRVNLGNGGDALYPDWFRPDIQSDGTRLMYDHRGEIMSKMAPEGKVFDQMIFPWENGFPDNIHSISEAFRSINWIAHSHTNYSSIDSAKLRERAIEFREGTDKAILMSGGAKLLELGFFLRRMDNFLMDLLADQHNLVRLLDKLMEIHLSGLEKKLPVLGDLVDVIRLGDDLGMTTGPFMDLDTFRTFFKPRYRELCDYIKQHSDLKIFFHSCGSIRQFIPDLIEVGFDIINPVQTNCLGMDPLELKNDFGREITFWGGGIDTSSVLPNGTVEEVRKDVLNRCETLSRGGGFIFAPIHNILPEVPPENIIAAYQAVREFNSEPR